MDKRLTGALAWGILALIVVGPGAEMLSRKSSTSNPMISPTSVAPNTAPLSAATVVPSAPPVVATTPEPAIAETSVARPEPLPEVASAPSTVAPQRAAPAAPAGDAPEARQPVTVIAAVPASTEPPPVPAGSQDAVAPALGRPVAVSDLPVTHVEKPDPAEVAARVRALILSDLPVAPADSPTGSFATIATAASSGVGIAAQSLPEKIPYPAPLEQRPRSKTIAVAAEHPYNSMAVVDGSTRIPLPQPVPAASDIRPDNAIFFEDWKLVPPEPIPDAGY